MNYEYEGGISEELICKNGWQSALGGLKTLLFISCITLLSGNKRFLMKELEVARNFNKHFESITLSFGYTNGLISVTNWIY